MTTARLPTELQLEALAKIDAYLEAGGEDVFDAEDVRVAQATMRVLLNADYLDKGVLWSNRRKTYRRTAQAAPQPPSTAPELLDDPFEVVPPDLFAPIVGYDDVKRFIRKTVTERRRIHHALIGPPATAKSMFLDEIARLPRAEWVHGPSATRAGVTRLLLERSPDFLVIDEADKMGRSDAYSVLLPLCETGRITETTATRRVDRQLGTIVFLSANDERKLPPAIQSRFRRWHFEPYTREEFIAVARAVLTTREGRSEDDALHIAAECWEHGARDVREPRAVARLCESREEIAEYLSSPHLAIGATR